VQAVQLAQRRARSSLSRVGVGAFEERLVPVREKRGQLLIGWLASPKRCSALERPPQRQVGQLLEVLEIAVARPSMARMLRKIFTACSGFLRCCRRPIRYCACG